MSRLRTSPLPLGRLGEGAKLESQTRKPDLGFGSRASDSQLRNKLIQSAWVSIRKDPELREFYRRVY